MMRNRRPPELMPVNELEQHLTLDSDDEFASPTSPLDMDDALTKDLAALEQLRKSVQNNLKLRPIRSNSNLANANRSPQANTYFTPLQSPARVPQEPQPISANELDARLSSSLRPLLIDTRPPAVHLNEHLPTSINIAIPSLILKRFRKPGAGGGLASLDALRQFITTDVGKSIWDGVQEEDRWDGSVVVYDEEMDDKSSIAWALIGVLAPLIDVLYLEGGMKAARGKMDTTVELRVQSGLFQLDTNHKVNSKIEIEQASAGSGSSISIPSTNHDRFPPLSPSSSSSTSTLRMSRPKSKSIPTLDLTHATPSPPANHTGFGTTSSSSFTRPSPPRRPSAPNLRRLDTSPSTLHINPPIPGRKSSVDLLNSLPKLQLPNAAANKGKMKSAGTLNIPPPLSLGSMAFGLPEKANSKSAGVDIRHAPPSPSALKLVHSNHFPSSVIDNDSSPKSVYATPYTSIPPSSMIPDIMVLPTSASHTKPDSAYFTPPHTPSTPRSAFPNSDLPPTPRTARPESSFFPAYPPSPSGYKDSFFPSHSHHRSDSTSSLSSASDTPSTEPPPSDFTISTILPQFLFLGPEPSIPEHVEMLKSLGVRRILNLALECGPDDWGLGLGDGDDRKRANGNAEALNGACATDSGPMVKFTQEEEEQRKAVRGLFERYDKIGMRDTVEEDGVRRGVREVCQILDDARLHSAPTYVHCKAGKSRSVTAVIAYLIHSHHWTLSRSYAFVLERRKGISPNIGFVSELMSWEEEELGGKSVGVVVGSHGAGHQGRGAVTSHVNGNADSGNVQVIGGSRPRGHVRESMPPALAASASYSPSPPSSPNLDDPNDSVTANYLNGRDGPHSGGDVPIPLAPLSQMSKAAMGGDVGQEMEIRDASGRYRHVRRAPVSEATLQPLRRVSKAGLESSGNGDWFNDE